MDSVPGVRKILWRREWHTGKNVQLVGVFVLHNYACQKAPTVEQEKNNYQAYQFQLAKVVTNIADSIAENEIRR